VPAGRHYKHLSEKGSNKQMRQAESVLAMKKFLAAGIGLMGCGCVGWLMGCAEVVLPGASKF